MMRFGRRHVVEHVVLLAILTGGLEAALAQTAPTAGAIEEIIVTAGRKGEESLQDIPAALTVLSEETLRKADITEISEVASRTPGFTFQEKIGNQQEIMIRGIGTLRLDGSSADPSVGLFIDEVYVGRRGAATPRIFDLERVEVVRGPQGTLYGKNVVGGAINFVSARPRYERAGRVALSFGEIDSLGGKSTAGLDAFLTGGFSDNVAGRVAVHSRYNDGYSHNVVLDEELDNLESYGIRGALLIEPNDALDIHLMADYSRTDTNGQSRKPVDDPLIDAPGPTFAFGGLRTEHPRESESPWTQYEDLEVAGLTGRFDWALNNGYNLTYLAALRYGHFVGRYALPGITSPPSLTDAVAGQDEEYTGITQDLRLASDPGGRLRWIGGLYYLREETDLIDNNIASSFIYAGPLSIGDILDGELFYDQRNVTDSVAVYGEGSWDLQDNLTLTLGGRYSSDQKDFSSRSECLDFGGPGGLLCVAPLANEFWDFEIDEKWSEFTPKVLMEWRPGDDLLFYASARRGFKGGGWQGKPTTLAAALINFDPETAWNYEIGGKTQWLDDRLRINAALFLTDFRDLQVEQLDDTGLTLIIDNAADAKIVGLELELLAALSDNIQFWFNGSWLETEYENFIDSNGADLSGNTLARAPELMFSTGLSLSAAVGDNLAFDARIEYNWQDDMEWSPNNDVLEDAYGLLDARLAIGPPAGGWEVALFGKNIADKLYREDVVPFLGDIFSRWGLPRTYGVQFTLDF